MIEGYGADRNGPPLGICEWCWRSTWEAGIVPRKATAVPVHITCLMQMNAINKKVLGRVPITGRTLAERRYLRLKHVAERRFDLARRDRLRLLPPQA